MSQTRIHISIPGTPVPTPRPRVTKYSVWYPRRYTDWVKIVKDYAALAVDEPTDHNVSVRIDFCYPRAHLADIDNLAKGVLDALAGIVYHDDRQVIRVIATKRKRTDLGLGRTDIYVTHYRTINKEVTPCLSDNGTS